MGFSFTGRQHARMSEERIRLALRQADQLRTDIANLECEPADGASAGDG